MNWEVKGLIKKTLFKTIVILIMLAAVFSICAYAAADEATPEPLAQENNGIDLANTGTPDEMSGDSAENELHLYLHADEDIFWVYKDENDDTLMNSFGEMVLLALIIITWIFIAGINRKINKTKDKLPNENLMPKSEIVNVIKEQVRSMQNKDTSVGISPEKLYEIMEDKIKHAITEAKREIKNELEKNMPERYSDERYAMHEGLLEPHNASKEDEAEFTNGKEICAKFRVYGAHGSVEIMQISSDNEEKVDLLLYKGKKYYNAIINGDEHKRMSRQIYSKMHFDFLFDAKFPEDKADDYQFEYRIPKGKHAVCKKVIGKDTFDVVEKGVIEIID